MSDAEQADDLETVATVNILPESELIRAGHRRDEQFQDSLRDSIASPTQAGLALTP